MTAAKLRRPGVLFPHSNSSGLLCHSPEVARLRSSRGPKLSLPYLSRISILNQISRWNDQMQLPMHYDCISFEKGYRRTVPVSYRAHPQLRVTLHIAAVYAYHLGQQGRPFCLECWLPVIHPFWCNKCGIGEHFYQLCYFDCHEMLNTNNFP